MKVSSSTLNIVRVVAMTGIVADHYFQASGNSVLVRTGLQWGGISDGFLRPICLLVRNEMGERR